MDNGIVWIFVVWCGVSLLFMPAHLKRNGEFSEKAINEFFLLITIFIAGSYGYFLYNNLLFLSGHVYILLKGIRGLYLFNKGVSRK